MACNHHLQKCILSTNWVDVNDRKDLELSWNVKPSVGLKITKVLPMMTMLTGAGQRPLQKNLLFDDPA